MSKIAPARAITPPTRRVAELTYPGPPARAKKAEATPVRARPVIVSTSALTWARARTSASRTGERSAPSFAVRVRGGTVGVSRAGEAAASLCPAPGGVKEGTHPAPLPRRRARPKLGRLGGRSPTGTGGH